MNYGGEGLVSQINCDVVTCARSTLGLNFDHDTRVGLPFPTDGGHQTIERAGQRRCSAARTYKRYTTEVRHYATLAQFGGGALGSDPITLVLGLSARRPARYTATPAASTFAEVLDGRRAVRRAAARLSGVLDHAAGVHPGDVATTAQQQSFGSAFYSNSLELGLRINQQIYLDAFYDAGNIWARPQDFDPTRLFRGVGFGGSIVTPSDPRHRLGVRTRSQRERREQAEWQMHFKLGQIF